MNEVVKPVVAVMAGMSIGSVFFGGLWWTVRMGVRSRHPALLFLGSLVARMAFSLAGFYLVGGGHWERMAACLLGFVLARMAVNHLIRPHADFRTLRSGETAHEA